MNETCPLGKDSDMTSSAKRGILLAVGSFAITFQAFQGALASPISPFTSGNTWGCLGSPVAGSPVLACSIGGQNHNVLSGEATVATTYGSLAANHATMTVDADGTANYGDIHADASASFDITGSPTTAFVRGAASFVDELTIDYAPWNGLPGLLYLSYSLDGTISSTGNGHAFADVIVQAGPTLFPAEQSFTQSYSASTSGTFSLPPINFIYGQPLGLYFDLDTFAGTATPAADGDFNEGSATGEGSGSALFSDTLVLTALDPTDLNGDPATGAQFSSASGTQYSIDGVVSPVPEPPMGLLSLLSTGVIAVLKRNRSKHQAS